MFYIWSWSFSKSKKTLILYLLILRSQSQTKWFYQRFLFAAKRRLNSGRRFILLKDTII